MPAARIEEIFTQVEEKLRPLIQQKSPLRIRVTHLPRFVCTLIHVLLRERSTFVQKSPSQCALPSINMTHDDNMHDVSSSIVI